MSSVQNLVKIHFFIRKILSGNKILTSFKGLNSVMNWRKWTINNPKLDVVNINAYVKFGQNSSKFSQDTVRKQKCYGWTDGQPQKSIPLPHTSNVGYNNNSKFKPNVGYLFVGQTMNLSMFSPRGGGGGGLDCQNSHCPPEFYRQLWHRDGTLDF